MEKAAKPVIKKETKKEVDSRRKVLTGSIVSAKMQNTVVVAVKRQVAHPLYGKLIKITKRFKADTNGLDLKEGDLVRIEQTKPMSKDKHFKVIKKEEAA